MPKTTHGRWKTKEWNSWDHMKRRCNNPNDPKYNLYGARGITVCERWLKFENFFEDMGEAPGKEYSLDRINNNGNYEPSNCRWATPKEQSNNTRRNRGQIRLIVVIAVITLITSCATTKCIKCTEGHCHEIKKPKYSLFR